MEHRRGGFLPFLILLLLAAGLDTWCRADLERPSLDRGKRATALVEVGEDSGTAFCIDAAGYFITNQHVVTGNPRVKLIVNAGQPDQTIIGADVVREDGALDLALLRADGKGPWTPLPLARSSAGLIETTPVTAFGFPFGTDLSVGAGRYPSVSVSTGHVTALRRAKGVLEAIQIDASLNPGNSGGPVLDGQGRVVGVVEKGIPGAALSFAIPVERLHAMLARPVITLSPLHLAPQAARRPAAFHIQVRAWDGGDAGDSVTLTLGQAPAPLRVVPARLAGPHEYAATAVLAPPASPPTLRLTVTGGGAPFVAIAGERTVAVGSRRVRLSDIATVLIPVGGARPAVGTVTLRDGAVLSGPLPDLGALPVRLGGVPVTVDLGAADPGSASGRTGRRRTIAIEDAAPPAPSVPFRVVVRRRGVTVGELAGTVWIAATTPGVIAAAPNVGAVVVTPVPGGAAGGPLPLRRAAVLEYPGGKGILVPFVADLDADGHPDILVHNGPRLEVLFGRGGGAFDRASYPISDDALSHIAVADLNADGRPDVVISGGDALRVLLATGRRSFAPSDRYPTGNASESIAVADFNRDGRPDLATACNHSARVAVLLNRGDGTFGDASDVPGGQFPQGLAAGDFDEDGNPDLIVSSHYSRRALLYLGDGRGGFRAAASGPDVGGGELAAADLNGDGRLDLAGLDYWGGGLGIGLGDGRGGFAVRRYSTGQYPSQIRVGDLDGDAAPDLSFGNQGTNGFTVYLNSGNGTLRPAVTVPTSGSDVHTAAIGDFMGHGRGGAVVDGLDGRLSLFLDTRDVPEVGPPASIMETRPP